MIQTSPSFPEAVGQLRRLQMLLLPLGVIRPISRAKEEGRTSTSCTTTVDELRSQYIPRRVQRSSSFHRDIPKAAPVAHRRGGKVTPRVEPTGGGSPVQHLEKPAGHVLLRLHLHDKWIAICQCSFSDIYFSVNAFFFVYFPGLK